MSEVAELHSLMALEQRMAEFLAANRDRPGVGDFLARMIRETAVAAYVRGTMHASPGRVDAPKDSVMLSEALETIRSMDDLYPAWRVFDGRQLEEGDGDA